MKPYFKKSHRAWYVNIGKPIRLATEAEGESVAMDRFLAIHHPSKISDIVGRFLDSRQTAATRKFYERRLREFTAEVGVAQVSDLKPYHLSEWLLKKSVGNYNRGLAVKTCFNWAQEQGYLSSSPFKQVKIGAAPWRGDNAYITEAEYAQFFDRADEDFKEVLIVLHETGCRPQELRAIEKRHLFEDTIRFPAEEAKGHRPRTIYLTSRATMICQRLALKYPEGRIFRRQNGKPWTAKALDRKFERVSKRSGVRINPYALRHSFATEAIIRRVDLQRSLPSWDTPT